MKFYNLAKAVIIVLLAAAENYCSMAQQGWNVLDPWPTNNAIAGVSFINETTGWFVAGGDCILKTTDGGSTWIRQSTQTGLNWYGVYFADAQHGWIADTWGSVSATTDGGNSWSQQAGYTYKYFYAMQFTDAQHGFVLLQSDSLVYTTNGGTNWNKIKIDNSQYHYGMKFVNPTEGWICGTEGQILHSTNGGITWTVQNTGTTVDLYTIDFTDNLHGWAAGYTSNNDGTVLHTSNGGTSWEILVQNSNAQMTRITFRDNNNGNAISNKGGIYRTTDGGSTWTQTYTSLHEGLLDIQVMPSGTGYACGTSGAMLKSTNNGASWSPIYKTATHGYTIRDLSFPDQKNGWVLDDAAYLRHTADSGNTWVDQSPFPTSFSSAAIHFVDGSRGWIAGNWPAGGYGQILRTTDGGNTFNFQLNTGEYPFISVSFSDSLHGIAGTISRMIYHTSNGGAVWDSVTVPATTAFMQVKNLQMVDNSTGYAILSMVNKTALAKTTNGGQAWSVIKTDNTQFTAAFTALSFTDAQNGYLARFDFSGTPNKFSLLKTIDGGTTWESLNFPSNLPGNIGNTQINALHFSDMQHGWAAGGGTLSFILYTGDGGNTWNIQELGTTVSWYTMKFIDAQTGFAAGWEGDIVKTTKGGVGVDEIQNRGINELTLYPNPAGGSVVIACTSLERPGKTEINMLDRTGRTVFSGFMTAAETTLNLLPYPNGLYIIRAATGNRTLTKKLIIAR